jgi:hypothetical protein
MDAYRLPAITLLIEMCVLAVQGIPALRAMQTFKTSHCIAVSSVTRLLSLRERHGSVVGFDPRRTVLHV